MGNFLSPDHYMMETEVIESFINHLHHICQNNDHAKALRCLNFLAAARKQDAIGLTETMACLIFSSNIFSEHDNFEFFKEFHLRMQDITMINPKINNFTIRSRSYYYLTKHYDFIKQELRLDDKQLHDLVKILADLGVDNHDWLQSNQFSTGEQAITKIINFKNRGIPLVMKTSTN